MGQYYKVIILADNTVHATVDGTSNKKEIIRFWICPGSYRNGMKLMEHSYYNNNLLKAVHHLLSPDGHFYMSRIIWAGDYADGEKETGQNLYHMAESKESSFFPPVDSTKYSYLVNHTKKEYVDMKKLNYDEDYIIHPLPLLVAEGNGRGGGDYYSPNEEMCGRWARDIISFEEKYPEEYNEIVPNFIEE
jgi:hypothetical protein